MPSEPNGFVSFQLRLRDVQFTSSRPDWNGVREDLYALGYSGVEVDEIMAKLRQSVLSPEVQEKAGERGVETAKKQFPAKKVAEFGPECGHGVRTVKRTHNGKDYWTCQAKNERGDFLWKVNKSEACAWVEIK